MGLTKKDRIKGGRARWRKLSAEESSRQHRAMALAREAKKRLKKNAPEPKIIIDTEAT